MNMPVERTIWRLPDQREYKLLTADNAFIERTFKTRSLVDRAGGRQPLNVFIPRAEGDLLYSLVRFLRPRVSIEVGLANGISAAHIAAGLRENGVGQHIAIDPFQHSDWADIGLATLEHAGVAKRVSVDQRPSHWVLPELESRGLRAQFAFIDGSHLFEYVIADFLGVDRILDVGGLIAFDDSDWPAITNVIRFALRNRNYAIFDTGTVIEPSPHRPRLAARWLRKLAARSRLLSRILSDEFVTPSHELGIRGRCVVLQKQEHDDRDCQTPNFVRF